MKKWLLLGKREVGHGGWRGGEGLGLKVESSDGESDPREEWERSPVATGVSRLEDLQSCPMDHWGVWEENPVCRGRS